MEYLTTRQVAELLQISVTKLEQDRARKRGLPYTTLGRQVRYARSDIDAYLFSRTVVPRNASAGISDAGR